MYTIRRWSEFPLQMQELNAAPEDLNALNQEGFFAALEDPKAKLHCFSET